MCQVIVSTTLRWNRKITLILPLNSERLARLLFEGIFFCDLTVK